MSWARRVGPRAGAWGARGAMLVLVAALGGGRPVGAQAPAPRGEQPAVAVAAAAAADPADGQHLQVILLTAGVGDAVWERFGHNLLWIRDTVTGEEAAWNWGKFSFDEPDFLQRFLLGDTRYWMEADDVAGTLGYYRATRREVVAQELALTPAQRAALQAFVRANAEGEARFYRYDYFRDNCSTRLRDALDLVLGGALGRALTADTTASSYRSETLRLVQDDAWLVAGIDLALGARADAPLTAWDAAFVPMRLRDALRTLQVDDGAGGTRPLVAREAVVVPVDRAAEAEAFAAASLPWRVPALAAGLALLGLLVGRAQRAAGRTLTRRARAYAVAVHGVIALLSLLVLGMGTLTKHAYWAWNPHLLLLTPLSLAIALTLLWRGAARPPRWLVGAHFVLAGGALALGLGGLVRVALDGGAPSAVFPLWALVGLLLHAGAGVALAPAAWLTGGSAHR